MERPLVSVLLPVYNGAAFLKEAIDSVLLQTYRHWELLIIDDGSHDDSAQVIHAFNDPRIRFYQQTNQGLAATLNRAILLAQGAYLARQDQDDVSLPERIEKQVAFLETHQACGMVGTWAEIWVGADRTDRRHQHPSENPIIKFDLLFDNPFVHSSVMLRRAVVERVGAYSTDKARQPPEDYELWSRVARHFDVANIPECLLVYREMVKSMSRKGVNPFQDKVINISCENLHWATGKNAADRDVQDLAALMHGAHHRVSLHPNLAGMTRNLFEAADGVSGLCDVDPDRLRKRAEYRLADLKHHYSHCTRVSMIRRGWMRLVTAGKTMVSQWA
jgi:glycosyl transferase family 2